MVRRFLATAGGAVAAVLLLAAPAGLRPSVAAAAGAAAQSPAADASSGPDSTAGEPARQPGGADDGADDDGGDGGDGDAEGRAPPAASAPPAAPAEPAPECAPDRGYRPPVAAPVTDPFRPPTHPFGPGNRGLEYATSPGSPVRAIGAGTVVFAGPVAGQLHVTVRHADGLRSTYSYLGQMAVGAAEPVARGQVVGWAGPRLHLGVRCGTAYLDPARLFGGRWRARLVPDSRFPGAPGPAGGIRSPPPP